MIGNAAAEQAVRRLCVGRRNCLHLGGDGGLKPTAVLLSVVASVKRHGVNPWAYLTHVLSELPFRGSGADLADLLPDAWAKSRGASPSGLMADGVMPPRGLATRTTAGGKRHSTP